MKKVFIGVFLALIVGGCTGNMCAKSYGGTMTVELPKGMKLVNATWKSSNLWYLYRQAKHNENPQTYYFKEDSNFGVVEGKVVFKEDF